MTRRLAALPLLLLLPLALAFAGRPDEGALVAELKKARDQADPARIVELADYGSRAALDGLLEVYGLMASIYMRREIVRVLPRFDGQPETEQAALQKLADVATDSREPELRKAAVEALGKARHLGKTYLVLIIDSPAVDDVREAAMEQHLALADEGDVAWYKQVYQTKEIPQEDEKKEKDKKPKGRGKEAEEAPPERKKFNLESLRTLAFQHIAAKLSDEEVIQAKQDTSERIRRAALRELQRRGWKSLEAAARDVLDDIEAPPLNRADAAAILIELNGPKEAAGFVELGQKFATPDYLRLALAKLLAELRDPDVDKRVAKLVNKGKPQEKVFATHAALHNPEKSVEKDLRKELGDKEPAVVLAALEVIAARKDAGAVPEMLVLLDKTKEERLMVALIDAIGEVVGPDPSWDARLEGWLASPDANYRQAALAQIAKREGAGAKDLLLRTLEDADWALRLASLKALAALRVPEVVGPIIDRMAKEEGRMLLEFADVLWTLTGQPYRLRQPSWKAWWEQEGAQFEVISEAELAKRAAEEEARRLKQVYNVDASFFGIRIVSHRVLFILDVSGSMAWDLRAEFEGQRPEPRIDVAKRELKKCIDGLEEGALFNMITFSGDVSSWVDGGVAGSHGRTRDEAKTYVDRLGAFGATNMYDALELAFEDPEVDTIYFLGDGEPTAGAVTDPYLIREEVQRWNEHRGVVIHTIAVGGNLQILQWLAEDSGGTHVQFQ